MRRLGARVWISALGVERSAQIESPPREAVVARSGCRGNLAVARVLRHAGSAAGARYAYVQL